MKEAFLLICTWLVIFLISRQKTIQDLQNDRRTDKQSSSYLGTLCENQFGKYLCFYKKKILLMHYLNIIQSVQKFILQEKIIKIQLKKNNNIS